MGLRDRLVLPRIQRRTRSETRREVTPDPIEGSSGVALTVPKYMASTPALGTNTPAAQMSGSSTPHVQESKGMWPLPSSRTSYLNNPFSCGNVADRSISGRFRSIFSKKRSKQSEGSPSHTANTSAIDVNTPDVKTIATSSAKLALRGVKETADAYPPLKSVVGCLCFILDNYEVRPWSLTLFQTGVLTLVPENDRMSPNDGIVDTSG